MELYCPRKNSGLNTQWTHCRSGSEQFISSEIVLVLVNTNDYDNLVFSRGSRHGSDCTRSIQGITKQSEAVTAEPVCDSANPMQCDLSSGHLSLKHTKANFSMFDHNKSNQIKSSVRKPFRHGMITTWEVFVRSYKPFRRSTITAWDAFIRSQKPFRYDMITALEVYVRSYKTPPCEILKKKLRFWCTDSSRFKGTL